MSDTTLNDPRSGSQENWDEAEFYEYLVDRCETEDEEDIEGIL